MDSIGDRSGERRPAAGAGRRKRAVLFPLVLLCAAAVVLLVFLRCRVNESSLTDVYEEPEIEEPGPSPTPVPTPTPEPTVDPHLIAYEEAVQHMYRREYEQALEKFAFADMHEQSKVYEGYCQLRLEDDFSEFNPIISAGNVKKTFDNGVLYNYWPVVAYVPNEINEGTRFSVYFAGGTGEYLLYIDGVYEYIRAYSPNAVLLFNTNSGTQGISVSVNTMLRIANQIAAECGISIHDLAISGSSNGCYTAVHAAAAFYTENSVAARAVLTFDTGRNWNLPFNMTEEEMDATAGTGIKYYLFEQAGTGTEIKAIYDLVASGNEVYAVYCTHDDHDRMSRLAYTNGLFSWGMGEFDELDGEEYEICLLTLDEEDTEDE